MIRFIVDVSGQVLLNFIRTTCGLFQKLVFSLGSVHVQYVHDAPLCRRSFKAKKTSILAAPTCLPRALEVFKSLCPSKLSIDGAQRHHQRSSSLPGELQGAASAGYEQPSTQC